MGAYRTIKCPHCKEYLQFWKKNRSHGKFGTPIIKCNSCLNLVKTKKKLWRDMDTMEKGMYYGSIFIMTSMWTVLPLIVISAILYEDQKNGKTAIIISGLIGLCLSIVFFMNQIQKLKKIIKVYEEDFDNKNFEYQDY